MRLLCCLWLLTLLAPAGAPAAQKARLAEMWEKSLVTLDVTRKQFDYFQPWTKRTRNAQKPGVVISGREILTTADDLAAHTLIRLQKGGRGAWFPGEVVWVDYYANLALITSTDTHFWSGLKAAELGDPGASPDNLQIIRWRTGHLDKRKAEFSHYTISEIFGNYVPQLHMEVNSEIDALGLGEVITSGKSVLGLHVGRGGGAFRFMPASFIRTVLEARRKNNYPGLGYFDFVWQPAENPEIHKHLKLPGEPRGVVVIKVPEEARGTLQPKDLILAIDGFAIDTQGDYRDPVYGHINLEFLAVRKKWAGDSVKLRVWREGREMDVAYRLPPVDFASKLLPDGHLDQEPQYLIAGGLVFQPLDVPFLRNWGEDWRRRAPFRLGFFHREPATPERPSLVVLSSVLPDPFNIGYQEARFLVLQKVNGRDVFTLAQLQEALKQPQDGFHRLEFLKGETVQRIVLDARELEPATRRIVRGFGIPSESVIHPAPASKNSAVTTARP